MRRAAALLVILGACQSRTVTLAEEWRWSAPAPAYVGMPASTRAGVAATYGHSYLALIDEGRLRWETRLVGLRDVAPRFRTDEVLAATDSGVAAFAIGDGALRWHRQLGDRASTPLVVEERVVVTTWNGRLVMLGGWSVDLPGPSLGPPVAAGNVVVASWTGGVVAVDASTGRVRWRRDFDGADTSAPSIFGTVAIAVGGDRRAHALDVRTGRERWSIAMKGAGSPEAPPAVDRDRVAVVDRLGHLVVVDHGGDERWSADGHGAVVRGGPVWAGDRVAVPLDDGRVMLASRRATLFEDPPGRISGLASSGATIVVATREASTNGLTSLRVS